MEMLKKIWEKAKNLWNKMVDWIFKGFYK